MMSKYFAAVAATLAICVHAQAQLPYAFSKDTATYVQLPAATKHIITGPWGPSFTYIVSQAIGVDMFNTTCDHSNFEVHSEGSVSINSYFTGDVYYASGMGCPSNGTVAEIAYELSGAISNQLLKVQFSNMFFAYDTTTTSYINYQVWLYESGNIIELHYRPGNYTAGGGAGISPGLFDVVTGTTNSIVLAGDPAAPVAEHGTYEVGTSLTGFPESGTVYRFTPNPTAVQPVNGKPGGITVVYQPAYRQVSVSSVAPIKNCEVYDLSGRIADVFTNVNATHFTINTENYATGVYIVKTLSDYRCDVRMVSVAK